MDKVTLLCDMQQYMLEEFHRRTLDALRRQRLIHLVLGSMQSFQSLNLSCQVDKGRHIIEHAASLVQSGTFPTHQDTQRLLAMSRNIDQVFIARGTILSARFTDQLPLIEPIRRQYIQFVLNETHQLLHQWQEMGCLRNALAMQYDVAQFSKLLFDMLHSIGLETRLLGQVVNVPIFIRFMRDTMSQTMYLTMDAVAHRLARDMAGRLFRSRPETYSS